MIYEVSTKIYSNFTHYYGTSVRLLYITVDSAAESCGGQDERREGVSKGRSENLKVTHFQPLPRQFTQGVLIYFSRLVLGGRIYGYKNRTVVSLHTAKMLSNRQRSQKLQEYIVTFNLVN